jgi:hypothetical protein
LLGLFVLIIAQQALFSLRLITVYRFAGYAALFMAFYFFVAGAFSSVVNLKDATKQCFIGSAAELSARIHQQIKLAGPLDWAMILNRALGNN